MEPMKYKHAVVGNNFHLQFRPRYRRDVFRGVRCSSLNAKEFSMGWQVAEGFLLKLLPSDRIMHTSLSAAVGVIVLRDLSDTSRVHASGSFEGIIEIGSRTGFMETPSGVMVILPVDREGYLRF